MSGPVAGRARAGLPNRKILKRLEERRSAYDKMKDQQGKHRPGSMQKK
jgi:hypothetical protein